ncbi:hypothetical protein LZ012_10800 [Dechloromonas sp. XY25]|uniref:DnrO protein n=1 Tax=Dechloromonas hankyongensis TaxID=2908002 RepID=A0ABS9K2S3_9RHOO|nr:hypothetical protein [Dechloromonas hankyongensis]MCG2577482.1 hypothetical protein [Dechloromonas hankyongensis]
MKPGSLALLLTVALAAASPLLAADHHHHGHAAQESSPLQLNAGKKWATDEALRQGMNSINQAMAKAQPQIRQNSFSDDQYRELAATIGKNVGDIVENCKLEPKADAMLHLVIADLQAGAEMMAGKTQGARHEGADKVFKSLKAYGQYFQHPGWKVAKT